MPTPTHDPRFTTHGRDRATDADLLQALIAGLTDAPPRRRRGHPRGPDDAQGHDGRVTVRDGRDQTGPTLLLLPRGARGHSRQPCTREHDWCAARPAGRRHAAASGPHDGDANGRAAGVAHAVARGGATCGAGRRVRLLGLLAAIGVLTASGFACRSAEDPNVIRLNGRLEAPLVDVAPKVTGRVLQVLVREGDRVKAGDVLVKLDLGETAIAVDRDRAAVGSAQARAKDMEAGSRQREIAAADADVADRAAALDLAKRELERQQYLLKRKVGTERDLDRAQTDLDRAQATLKAARDRAQLTREGFRKWQTEQARTEVTRAQAQLRQSESVAGEAELRAPADAVVLHRIAEPGLLLAGGQPALTLAFTDRLYVRTFVPETQLGRVKPGNVAEVTVDAHPGRTFPARVAEISPQSEFTPKAVETREERVNLVYASKVDLDRGWSEPLVPGQPAEVVIRTGGSTGAAAQPASAPAPGTAPASTPTPAPAPKP